MFIVLICNVVLLRKFVVAKKNVSDLGLSIIYYKECINDVFIANNRKMNDLILVDHRGMNVKLSDIHKRFNNDLLVVYFPGCICAVEKDVFLEKINSIYKKAKNRNVIFVFNEYDYDKIAVLSRLGVFDCDLFCDVASAMNINEKKRDEIFTFILDRDFKIRNLIYPRLINGEIFDAVYVPK